MLEKKLQTAFSPGLNDNIMDIGTMSRTSTFNAMEIVSKNKRSKRSHAWQTYSLKQASTSSQYSLISNLISIYGNNETHHLCKL